MWNDEEKIMDPIADMFVSLKNANHKIKESVDVPASKLKAEVARVLKEEGFISNFRVARDRGHATLRINLKYAANKDRVLQGIKRVSKPSLRIFKKSTEIPSVQNGLGIAILSTSQGVMSGHKAKEKKVGGEVLCFVW